VNNTLPPEPPSQQSAKKPPKRQPKPVPATLTDSLLAEKVSARRFVQSLVKRRPLSDDDLAQAQEILNAQPSKIRTVVDLARAAAQTAPQPAILLRWCEQVVRSRDEALRGWALDPDQDARAAFSELLRWTFATVGKKGDRSRRNTVEASLLIGLNLLLARRSLAPLDALRSIASDAEGHRPTRSGIQSARLANKLLVRAGVKHLLDLAQIAGLAEAEIAGAEDARRQALSLVNDLRRDKEALEASQSALNAERQDIERELGERNHQIAQLAADLEGVRARALQDLSGLKARFRRQIGEGLEGLLADAWNAIDTDPPHPDVARERLEIARKSIREELEWLNKSSD
jgi:hypothetical protein